MADLATLLESEAQAEIEMILAEAHSKAEGIMRVATEQAKSITEGRKRALESELLAGQVRARSSAELESSALRLKAGQSATEKAFAGAAAELRAFTKSGEYQGVLTKLMVEVKTSLGHVSKLEVNPNDFDIAQQAAAAAGLSGALIVANTNVETGVRALPDSGQTSVTNTLLGRLSRARDGLLSDVARVLAAKA